ncbi:hypothetical protein BKA63DRAFT_269126 [Paraphoma chrysanthemicola]|nr:hypothetical protein BKA63DRAFT_269126 [Paraphoma chrysanthemicola]
MASEGCVQSRGENERPRARRTDGLRVLGMRALDDVVRLAAMHPWQTGCVLLGSLGPNSGVGACSEDARRLLTCQLSIHELATAGYLVTISVQRPGRDNQAWAPLCCSHTGTVRYRELVLLGRSHGTTSGTRQVWLSPRRAAPDSHFIIISSGRMASGRVSHTKVVRPWHCASSRLGEPAHPTLLRGSRCSPWTGVLPSATTCFWHPRW